MTINQIERELDHIENELRCYPSFFARMALVARQEVLKDELDDVKSEQGPDDSQRSQ